MQFDLLLSTLYQMQKKCIEIPNSSLDLLNVLSKSVQQIRTVKLATHNINIAYNYYIGRIPKLQRKLINFILKLVH